MSLDKAGLKSAIQTIFEDLTSATASAKAQDLADAIDVFVKTAFLDVSIPAGAVIVTVTGGSGAPAIGVANITPINISGDPDAGSGSDDEGGIS